MDVVFDRTAEGRAITCLAIVDDATHEAVAIDVERAIATLLRQSRKRVLAAVYQPEELLEAAPVQPMLRWLFTHALEWTPTTGATTLNDRHRTTVHQWR